MADVARIVLPPKRDETEPSHTPPQSSQAIVPPAFPVAAMTARVKPAGESRNLSAAAANLDDESPFLQKTATPIVSSVPLENPPFIEAKTDVPSPKPTENLPPPFDAPKPESEAQKLEPNAAPTSENVSVASQAPSSIVEEKTVAPDSSTPPKSESIPEPSITILPKVDPEAHKPPPSADLEPRVDPEAHKPETKPVEPAPASEGSLPAVPKEKREFHLANGERVAGVVLSETPDAIYLEHATLGVLTVPRAQIAKRLVEIILINGDRIVGDIMAETADTLYVRHASLGMLTVPRAQRSTRVVEAILKDGDRIVGEVLTETETSTVIRSATLGTITVPHSKVAMLNRKVEQIELKALPPTAPELKDKAGD
jgi:RNase P/RNase MRP subunit p29